MGVVTVLVWTLSISLCFWPATFRTAAFPLDSSSAARPESTRIPHSLPVLQRHADTNAGLSAQAVDCVVRDLALHFAHTLNPDPNVSQDVFYALRLGELCNQDASGTIRNPPVTQRNLLSTATGILSQPVVHVDSTLGFDFHDGSELRPVRSLQRALHLARQQAATITLRPGVHYLQDTLRLGPQDSGLTIQGTAGETTVSGGVLLDGLAWSRQGDSQIYRTSLPEAAPATFDSLFVNDVRAVRARYPNANPETQGHHTNPSGLVPQAVAWVAPRQSAPATEIHISSPLRSDHLFQDFQGCIGGPAAAFNPPKSYWACNNTQGGGAATYAVPSGLIYDPRNFSQLVGQWQEGRGIVHAFHGMYWGSWMFRIAGVDREHSRISWDYGGFQDARGWPSGAEWYVEDILAELDTPGEWYLDSERRFLYYYPNSTEELSGSRFVAAVHTTLLAVAGSKAFPAAHITLTGLTFTHSAPTYMERYEAAGGGDWSVYRGGAVVLEGTLNVTIQGCRFLSLGGNALFLSNYNRDTKVLDNEFAWIGDTAIGLLGSTVLNDATDGLRPRHTLIQGNVIREVGIFTKQSAAVLIALSEAITIRRNIMFNGPRAGINVNDGLAGGHLIENNLMFNWCRETFDHGNINSWDRLPYLVDHGEGPTYTPRVSTIRRNLLFGNYHSTWPSDHDDGSAYWLDESNVMVYGGWKMFMGHSSIAQGNLYLYPDLPQKARPDFKGVEPARWGFDIPFCIWHYGITPGRAGYATAFLNNTCIMMEAGTPYSLDACDLSLPMHDVLPRTAGNTFITPAAVRISCGARNVSLSDMQQHGFELGSTEERIAELTAPNLVARMKAVLQL